MNDELSALKEILIHAVTKLQSWGERHHEDCRCGICLAAFSLCIAVELLAREIEQQTGAEV